jgi:flagellar biosynthesis protein FlhG
MSAGLDAPPRAPEPAPAVPRFVARRAPLVLLSGGKGGVGKTTVATNLAVELARRGRRTLLVDTDFGLGDVQVFLRIAEAPTIEDALAGRRTLADCLVRARDGLDVLLAGNGTAAMGHLGAAARERFIADLGELAHDYDLVLADGAAGIGPDVLGLASAADHVLVVTTPEPAAVTDAYGLIKALVTRVDATHGGVPELSTPEIVVNRAAGIDEARSIARKLGGVCERFLARSPRMAGWLPASRSVASSAIEQRPFADDERADGGRRALVTSCLGRLAERLEALARPAGALSRAQGRSGDGR